MKSLGPYTTSLEEIMSQTDPSRTPVIVSVGQVTEKDAIVSAIGLAESAARKALEDAPGVGKTIDRLTLVAISFSNSILDAPGVLARMLGLENAVPEHSSHGGNIPQFLVNRASEDIASGVIRSTLIVGAEATRSMRKENPAVNFLKVSSGNMEIEKTGTTIGPTLEGMLNKAEASAGLLAPSTVYPMFESVLAKRSGRTHEEQRKEIANLMARFTEVAQKNPYAWFSHSQRPEEISEVTDTNRLIAEPYTRSMNSFPNVDQGAALIVTNLATATEAGLADQCVFPWSGAEMKELQCTQRPDLGTSPAMTAASNLALTGAGMSVDDVDHIDFYSCFPVAVEVAAAGLGLAPSDSRDLTVTGGLPYFGGPGNNYSTHAIAAMVERIRETSGKGLVTANGGFMSKHAAGIYGAKPSSKGFHRVNNEKEQGILSSAAIPVVQNSEGSAVVDAATVSYDREGKPSRAPIIATLSDGSRTAARAAEDVLSDLAGENLIGRTVRLFGSPTEYRPV